jgi:hypothetical protein
MRRDVPQRPSDEVGQGAAGHAQADLVDLLDAKLLVDEDEAFADQLQQLAPLVVRSHPGADALPGLQSR